MDADINKDGTLELSELREILKKASSEFSHLEEHALFLEGCTHAYFSLSNSAVVLSAPPRTVLIISAEARSLSHIYRLRLSCPALWHGKHVITPVGVKVDLK